ncbi:galactose-binding protein [Flavobacterium seoulense]|uniref:Galactose-binding protein n=1 Tax=Flavobacterium seoulense TaxID=1492738 RepID=A0A066X117_9FLAO|nr:galactose-binding protein [Flavobacterium seoulense]
MSLFTTFVACSEDQGPQPLEKNTTPPAEVTNVAVENLPGKVRLTYTLPSDEDLLYVVARYKLENGRAMEAKASYYSNSLLLEGFTGQSTSEVKIYAVNRSETESKAVTITVAPDKAPIYNIYESLIAQPDFGGIRITADNPTKEEIGILVMQKNIQGDWEPLSTSIYTSVDEIKQSLRGFEAVPQDFAIVVRDKWLNYTDTLYTKIEPFFEQLMPKSGFTGIHLANDTKVIGTYPVSNLFDGQFLEYWGSYFTDRTVDVGNHLVTFDIGKTTKLSRLRIWNFSEPIGGQRLYYYLGAMKKFRIWGSNTLNDGTLDSNWTLLGEYEIKKPSGLPYGQENNDDLLAARDGADYEVSLDKPAVRYLRIECLENWIGGKFMAVSEVHVYGNPNF